MGANHFVWYELLTSDVTASERFYGSLMGWEMRDSRAGPERCVIVSAKGKDVAGMMCLPQGMTQPIWVGCVGTSDIQAAIAKLQRTGGTVVRDRLEIPQVGRIVLICDDHGAQLGLVQGPSAHPSDGFIASRIGHTNWHELYSRNPDDSLRFYSSQFGWTAGTPLWFSATLTYPLIEADGTALGGVRTVNEVRPTWLYYFGVRDIRRAARLVRDQGGRVLHEPMSAPGNSLVLAATDPQGAVFALVQFKTLSFCNQLFDD